MGSHTGSVEVTQVNTRSQAQQLDTTSPDSLAVLPFNYYSVNNKSNLHFDVETITVKKLIEEEGYDPEEIVNFFEGPATEAWSAGGVGPVIFFGADFLTNNWQAVLSILSVLGSWYLAQGGDEAVLNVVTNDEQIHYEGPATEVEPVLKETLGQKRDELIDDDKETDPQHDDKEPDSS